jgi:large subunit ribosomal protein L5
MAARLEAVYKDKIVPELVKQFEYESIMQVPRILKVTLNMGVGEAAADKKILNFAVEDMTRIAGQKPIITMTRQSIAGFKIREDWPIGCKVTLRREMMYEFLDRLISIYLPRVRDFRGISKKAFDGQGNFNLGVKEQTICPEIPADQVDKTRGFNITITTSARTDEEGFALLAAFNFPFKENRS